MPFMHHHENFSDDSLNFKKVFASNGKYMRARELAEKEAKKHIDRLNELMQKRLSKEKKFVENL